MISNPSAFYTGQFVTGSYPDNPDTGSFFSIWNTSKTSTGSSTATQIKLPLISTGTYNFVVDWGDGSTNAITVWNQAETTHTYTTAGVYKVKITGTCNGWRFANTGDRLKFLSVQQWGNGFKIGTTDQHFYGCSNLLLDYVRDVLDLTGTISFASSFRGCSQLRTVNRMNEWNTSAVTSLNATFYDSYNFNSPIGNWNTANVTDMVSMFYVLITGITSGKFNQNISKWNTSKVTNMSQMFYNQANFNQDISTKVVTVNGSTYTAWDTLNVTNIARMFDCFSATTSGVFNQNIGNWNTSKVTSFRTLFQKQAKFNQDISTKIVTVNGSTYTAWDTLNVTDMSYAFAATTNLGQFNQNIGNWNTSKVTTMQNMISSQDNFNQDISTKVVTVGASTYTAWDTLNVTNLAQVLTIPGGRKGSFNQNIGNWNTSKVTLMTAMLYNQGLFDQDISTKVVTVGASTYTAWDTLNATDISFIFGLFGKDRIGGGIFNQNIGNWNTSKVTTISSLFQNQPLFNQDISTKTVTVGASTYTAWNTANVTAMRYVFFNHELNTPSQFNQNIGNWNTVKATDMTTMFYGATSFNQNLSNWNVSLVTAFNFTTIVTDTFADRIGLSTANYDALLIGWATRPVKPNLAIGFGTVKYSSAAAAARAVLTSAPNNWTIIDGGLL